MSAKATDRKIGIKYKPERFGDQNYTTTKLETDIKTFLKKGFKAIDNDNQIELEQLLKEKTNDTDWVSILKKMPSTTSSRH